MDAAAVISTSRTDPAQGGRSTRRRSESAAAVRIAGMIRLQGAPA